MKVIILTEGGQNIGFGHLARCLSLCQAFEARGYEPEFIINGDQSVKNILQDRKFKILNWIKEEKELAHGLKDIDVVILDSYLAGPEVYKTISGRVKVPVFLDDYRRLDYPPGIVLNWNIQAHELDYPQNVQVTYLLGPKYISLRRSFWEVREKKINQKITEVMVTFGGDDSKNLTPKVLEFLTGHYPALKKNIIIGDAFTNQSEIEAAADTNTYLIKSPDETGMKEIMLKSDIAVSSAGQTLHELARVGVPTVAMAVADNQRNNLNGWEKAGFIENAGFWTDERLVDNIGIKFQRLLDFDLRVQYAGAGRRMVPGNGADMIIDCISTLYRNY